MTRAAGDAASQNRSFGSSDRRFGLARASGVVGRAAVKLVERAAEVERVRKANPVRDLFHQQVAAFVQPHRLVQKHRHTFRDKQVICVEVPTEVPCKANEGARKIYEALRTRLARCSFTEPPGKHSDQLPERLQRGIAWVFGRL